MKKVEQIEVLYIKQTTALVMAVVCLVVGFGLGVVFIKLTTPADIYRTDGPEVTQTAPVIPGQDVHAAAIIELKQILANDPKNDAAWANLGNHYFDSNRFDEAIDAYRKHLELNPGNADVWTDMGIMYRHSKRWDEAIRCFDKAVEVNPQHEQARFNKGVVLIFDVQKKEEGFAVWRELLKINPGAKAPSGQPLGLLIEQYSKTTPRE